MMDGRPTSDSRIVSVRRLYECPRENVFRAWTEPELIEQWFGPRGYRAEVLECDLRVGGRWRFRMIGEDGPDVIHYGSYVEIDPWGKLVFTWAPSSRPRNWLDAEAGETLVTVEFLDHGASTEVIVTHEGLISDPARKSLTGGWSGGLECLADFLSTQRERGADGHAADAR